MLPVYQCLDSAPSGCLKYEIPHQVEASAEFLWEHQKYNWKERNVFLCVYFSLSAPTPDILSCFDFLQVFASFNFHQGKPSVKKIVPNSFPLCHLLPPCLVFYRLKIFSLLSTTPQQASNIEPVFWHTAGKPHYGLPHMSHRALLFFWQNVSGQLEMATCWYCASWQHWKSSK